MSFQTGSQNELGRLCDECAYQADLKARLLADGFSSVLTEIPVTVTHRDFTKKYYLDLVVEDALYEFKVNSTLVGEHEAQVLNYMFLLGIPRGKLLNFRPAKVQGKILATKLTPELRSQFTILCEHWQELSPACASLCEALEELLRDWGASLEVGLYQEALVHCFGGAGKVEQLVQLRRAGLDLGPQRMLVYAPGMAFRLTAVTEDQQFVESHIRRLLALTNLKAIQWINLNHAQIEFTTIEMARE